MRRRLHGVGEWGAHGLRPQAERSRGPRRDCEGQRVVSGGNRATRGWCCPRHEPFAWKTEFSTQQMRTHTPVDYKGVWNVTDRDKTLRNDQRRRKIFYKQKPARPIHSAHQEQDSKSQWTLKYRKQTAADLVHIQLNYHSRMSAKERKKRFQKCKSGDHCTQLNYRLWGNC